MKKPNVVTMKRLAIVLWLIAQNQPTTVPFDDRVPTRAHLLSIPPQIPNLQGQIRNREDP